MRTAPGYCDLAQYPCFRYRGLPAKALGMGCVGAGDTDDEEDSGDDPHAEYKLALTQLTSQRLTMPATF
jgi:hypothetical protein